MEILEAKWREAALPVLLLFISNSAWDQEELKTLSRKDNCVVTEVKTGERFDEMKNSNN